MNFEETQSYNQLKKHIEVGDTITNVQMQLDNEGFWNEKTNAVDCKSSG